MNCVICDNYELKSLSLENIPYWQCPHCMALMLDPSKWLFGQEEKSRYETHNNDLSDQRYRNYLEGFIKYFFEDINKPMMGLDFGSGPGESVWRLLREKKFSCEHFDPYFHPDEQVWQKKYDYIIMCEVLEHIKDPLPTLFKLKEHLTQNSFLIIRTLRYNESTNLATWWYRRDPTHIIFYHDKTMQYLAEKLQADLVTYNEQVVRLNFKLN